MLEFMMAGYLVIALGVGMAAAAYHGKDASPFEPLVSATVGLTVGALWPLAVATVLALLPFGFAAALGKRWFGKRA